MNEGTVKNGSGEGKLPEYSDNYSKAANAASAVGPEPLKEKRHVYPYMSREPRPVMPFEQAFSHLRAGAKIKRAGWKGYWVFLNDVSIQSFNTHGEGAQTKIKQGMIVAHKADGTFAPAMPYQDDMLALDWEVIG